MDEVVLSRIGALDNARTEIERLVPDDRDALIHVGAAIEKVRSDLRDDAPEAAHLLTLCLEGLQGIYQGSFENPEDVVRYVARCVGAVERVLQTGGNLDESAHQAGRMLWTAMGREIEACPFTAALEQAPTIALPQVEIEAEVEDDGPFVLVPPDADAALFGEFVTECLEYIEAAEAALLELETNPSDTEAVNTVFRAFHTVKGTSAFLGLDVISRLAHAAESVMSRVRDNEIRFAGGYADLTLRSIDTLKELVQAIPLALEGTVVEKPSGLGELMRILSDPEGAGVSDEPDECMEPPRLGDLLVAEGKATREGIERAAAGQGTTPIGAAIVRSKAAGLTEVAKALRAQQRIKGATPTAEASVRVRTERLDRLIDMVGELVIAQSMVAQDPTVTGGTHHELHRKVTHAGKIVRELQDLSMSMRMVPLRPTFQKMTRLVRDLAHKSGKTVQFVTEGEDTEIDRNMVDVINDPLVHMVRNAVDHGIESPDEREAGGKPRIGTVRLSASHSGGNVLVSLQDDGKGLDRDEIVRKAISKGLIESDLGMSDTDVCNLIFAPGFSTAKQITDVSGRGVGMDVVKRGVEALRGRVDISSKFGQGTLFTMRLPLTMAITDGMLVRVGEQRYIVPTINISMTFRPEEDALWTVTGRGEMVMLRDELMPIFRLHRLFEIDDAVEDPTQGLLVVLDDGDRHYTLLVDELLGQQQVVAKPLGEFLGRIPSISGGAILGDGRVGLIIDPPGLSALARMGASAARSARETADAAA